MIASGIHTTQAGGALRLASPTRELAKEATRVNPGQSLGSSAEFLAAEQAVIAPSTIS